MSLVLGLDVGEQAVRGVFLRTTLRGAQVEKHAEAKIADGEDQPAALEQAIADVLAQHERAPDRVVAALDGEEVSVRTIDLPPGVLKRLDDVLPFEMESLLPFSLEESVVDHQIVRHDEDKLRVLAVAAPTQSVADRLSTLEAAGVRARELGAGAAVFDGLAFLVPNIVENVVAVLVNIGPRNTDVCILDNGVCAFARTISGGMDLVEGGRRDVLGASLKRTLASYRATSNIMPDIALLSGEASEASGAANWLKSQLGIECSALTPFAKAEALAGRTQLRTKRIDLRKGRFASTARAGQLRKQFKLLAVCAAAILLSAAFSLLARYHVANAENARLRADLSTLTQDLFKVGTDSPTEARALLERGAAALDPLPRFDAFDALEAVSDSIATDIKHDTRRLLIEVDDEGDDGRLEVQGTIDSIEQRDRIIDELQNHECFEAADKQGTISGAPDDRKNYKIDFKVSCPANKPLKAGKNDGAK